MLLLHIADIHFRFPQCASRMDADRPFRTLLIKDARDRAKKLGAVDAILVGGDIAFRGAAEEYSAALTWLYELADACRCPHDKIFVVPGNHDVDRQVVTEKPEVQAAHSTIAAAPPTKREQLLFKLFRDDGDGARALLAPVSAYNKFAAVLNNCQLFPPEQLFWIHDLPLDDHTILRIHGLTTTLLSGMNGADDTRGALYLSPLQTVLDPVDGVVNLVLCHHPPDWLLDQDDVDDALRARAAIHLFGHKHRARVYKDDRYIRFSAGAVNPDRNEAGWEPGYNLIRLSAAGTASKRRLVVEARVLVWQTDPDMFKPKNSGPRKTIFRHHIPITSTASIKSREAPKPGAETTKEIATAQAVDLEAAMRDERMRKLIFRFWSLTGSQRREIVRRLRLLDDAETKLPEPERYGRALIRASERGLLDPLADEIEKAEKQQ